MIGGHMKKYFGILIAIVMCVFVFTGCEKVSEGNYKEGTYYGSVIDSYGGSNAVASAVIYVDSTGI